MARHRKYWRCSEGHGTVHEYSDPGYVEIPCGHGDGAIRLYSGGFEEGEACRYIPVFISRDTSLERCKGTMKLERDEVAE